MFVDSHCHLEMEDFETDRADVVNRSVQEGLTFILTVGTEEKYFAKVVEIVDTYPCVYGALGIHPHNGKEYTADMRKRLASCLQYSKIVALGEIGLDFFRNHSPREAQVRAFEEQIALAKELNLPIIVHSRDSKKETLSILKDSLAGGAVRGVIHCFSYDLETAKRLLDMGFYISIPGTITYKNNSTLAEVVEYIPSDRLLAETDAPFLTPQPHRGKRNLPYFVKITVARLAAIRHVAVEETASRILDNFTNLFLANQRGDTL
jgi:TatD DNase family protein